METDETGYAEISKSDDNRLCKKNDLGRIR